MDDVGDFFSVSVGLSRQFYQDNALTNALFDLLVNLFINYISTRCNRDGCFLIERDLFCVRFFLEMFSRASLSRLGGEEPFQMLDLPVCFEEGFAFFVATHFPAFANQ
jgi:hypothetical protein